jgi:septal ring factor EnvC (AmiA/AmiB activator)
MEDKDNYFSCDYCHRVGTGITIVNGFKMCPMCLAEYQHKSGENNELREELGKKVKEVEQLKEKNKELKTELNDWKQRFNSSEERYKDLMQSYCECIQVKEKEYKFENNQLKQQLAEKDELLKNAVVPK